jgi:hypothetical protein
MAIYKINGGTVDTDRAADDWPDEFNTHPGQTLYAIEDESSIDGRIFWILDNGKARWMTHEQADDWLGEITKAEEKLLKTREKERGEEYLHDGPS